MSRAKGFINWVQEGWEEGDYYRPVSENEFPQTVYFDLSYKVTGSLMKGKQWYLFKILSPDISIDTAYQLHSQKIETIKFKSRFFRLLQNYLIFFYISDVKVSREVLSYLGDFTKARKNLLGNVTDITVFIDTTFGEYLLPYKSGFVGAVPIRKIYSEIRSSLLDPYQSWIKSQ
jgi:hypothetical protein